MRDIIRLRDTWKTGKQTSGETDLSRTRVELSALASQKGGAEEEEQAEGDPGHSEDAKLTFFLLPL